MSERQANIQLLNSKLAELDYAANDLLWDKIEAQLAAPATVNVEETPPNPAAAASKPLSKFLVGFFFASIVFVVCYLIYQEKKAATPAKPVEQELPIIAPNPLSQGKKDSTTTIKQTTNPQKKLIQPMADTFATRTFDKLPVVAHVSTNNNLVRLPLQDSLHGLMPVMMVTDTIRYEPQAGTDDGYYFDVKKKGKKNKKDR